jgi:hypothetical protein
VVRCALFESMINYNSRTNEKSTTRTIRIPQKLDKLLERDAENKRGIINSLISSIITKYAEWDRYSELLQFVSIPPDMFKLLAGSLDDEKIKGNLFCVGNVLLRILSLHQPYIP